MLTEKAAKKKVENWMNFLIECKAILDTEGKSLATQKKVQAMKYEGFCPEVESPELENTGGDWIRLNYEDCYLFLHEDGTVEYQYDPNHGYGGELIVAYTHEAFHKALSELENIRQYFD